MGGKGMQGRRGGEVAGDKVGASGHGAGMRWVLMLFVVLAAVMGGEASIDCSAGPGGAWPIGGNGLGKRVLTAEAEMRLEPGAGQLAAGEVLVAWRGESVVELANLPEADTATWNLEFGERACVPGRSCGDLGAQHLPDAEGVVRGGRGRKAESDHRSRNRKSWCSSAI